MDLSLISNFESITSRYICDAVTKKRESVSTQRTTHNENYSKESSIDEMPFSRSSEPKTDFSSSQRTNRLIDSNEVQS